MNKLISYFPIQKQNFKILNIYKASRDGLNSSAFSIKVFNKGPTLILIKTKDGDICGGYTSKNWDASDTYVGDPDAFLFNMQARFNPSKHSKSIYTYPNGFCFGDDVLSSRSV